MLLWRLFWTNPVMAFALCVCLVTIFWCIRFLHKRQKGWDRFLAALIGVVAIFQGMRRLHQAGVINNLESFAVDHGNDSYGHTFSSTVP